MRICMLQSSFEGSKSGFKAEDSMPNPGHYVDPEHHTFEQRCIRKFAEKEDIDAIVAENFDMYMNFMWGQHYDDVSGVEATRYLESKGVPVIGSPFDYMAFTKADLKRAALEKGGFQVPSNTSGKYPKIVKFVDGMASIGMDQDSICYTQTAVDVQIKRLQGQEPDRQVIVEDFIRGIETTAIIVEMGSEVVALPPVDWVFHGDTPDDQAWLSFTSKFEDLEAGRIHFEFVQDKMRSLKIGAAGVAAFKALGLQGRGAWGRIDARVDQETGEVYCLEMNHLPAIFFPQNEAMSDDIIIRNTYPGGHEAFIDMLIYTKQYQMSHPQISERTVQPMKNGNGVHLTNGIDGGVGSRETDHGGINGNSTRKLDGLTSRGEDGKADIGECLPALSSPSTMNGNGSVQPEANGTTDRASVENEAPTVTAKSPNPVGDLRAHGMTIADVYDSATGSYDTVQATMDIRKWQIQYFGQHRYEGTVLDLACGTGGIGMLIREAGNTATIHGVDVSPKSLQMQQVKKYYNSSTEGYLQDVVMGMGMFDHIVCFGALHFLSRVQFNATLSRMFMLARTSVAFDVDDVSQEYVDLIISHFGEGLRNHNNIKAYKRFGTPPGWRKVVEEERSLFYSPSVKIDVPGIVVRFERIM